MESTDSNCSIKDVYFLGIFIFVMSYLTVLVLLEWISHITQVFRISVVTTPSWVPPWISISTWFRSLQEIYHVELSRNSNQPIKIELCSRLVSLEIQKFHRPSDIPKRPPVHTRCRLNDQSLCTETYYDVYIW